MLTPRAVYEALALDLESENFHLVLGPLLQLSLVSVGQAPPLRDREAKLFTEIRDRGLCGHGSLPLS